MSDRAPKSFAAADPDLVVGSNGRLYANAASLTLAQRQGRRVIRCCELSPGEERYFRERIADAAGDMLVAFEVNAKGHADGE